MADRAFVYTYQPASDGRDRKWFTQMATALMYAESIGIPLSNIDTKRCTLGSVAYKKAVQNQQDHQRRLELDAARDNPKLLAIYHELWGYEARLAELKRN